ncbi:hypothetical protein [Streptomyces sp. NBC_01506]|uniref:hypothetical protein n=1 Tax=Streptomyces sp. NBC_01506 TaxID=2903887 RepID=UPI00386D1E39
MSVQLRDQFFALSSGDAPADEVARYRAQVDATDADIDADTASVATVDGLTLSWHPTARHKAVRFIDAELIEEPVRELFARPSEEAPYLAAVFVDPRELSFRTYENILPLDRLFTGVPLDLELTGRKELARGVYSYALSLPADARASLERLDSLNLYVPPLNAVSRGGERFIFHSALLADALTEAMARAIPDTLREGFSHVNPVFRCNRFEPDDTNFHRHRDTPYYDAGRGHISRYTVLLYLTGGSAEPALDLTPVASLTEIDAFTCVIFDQRYEHEGAPYADGRKVFLRTELVFAEPEPEAGLGGEAGDAAGISHDPAIGELFSRACYLTGESVFAPELARHADAYYNQVAAAHWNGLVPRTGPEPFVHKDFRGVRFVANGYDFWFGKSGHLSLAECATVALLDYFNCKIGGTAFRALCESEVIEAEDTDWIPAYLRDRPSDSAVAPIDKSFLFPEAEDTESTEDADICCPFHRWGAFDPTRHSEIVELYEEAQSATMEHIMPAPVVMLGEDVFLDPEKFVIRGNAIHVLGKKALTPVNFAACWNAGGMPHMYIETEVRVGVAEFVVPPILFTESADGYHLQFDFFRNSWMVNHSQAEIPVPRIHGEVIDDDDPDPDHEHDYGHFEDELADALAEAEGV